ncbi:MAG: amidase [Rhodocyclaceae bacterium]|nr:amidase [Rhodocyclaceae bacterium]
MDDLPFRSASELAAALRDRTVGCRELLERHLERVEALNPAINAVVTLDAERARRRADEADGALARGEAWGPLHGLPMTLKDSWETAGLRTTSGAPEFAGHVPAADAPAARRLIDAGAIVFGKTNLPAHAADLQSHNPLFGTTVNPWDPARTCGGSSGGAAAALAAGFTPLELGSDIGGSIRTPAGFCGVFGHKTSYGLIPMRGHIPGPPGSLAELDIGVAGPMARTAADLSLALDLLAGPLPEEAVAWRLRLPGPRRRSPREFRVAAWLDDPACLVDGAVADVCRAAVETLRRAGVPVDEAARPGFAFAEAWDLYLRLMYAATSGGPTEAQFARLATAAAAAPPGEDGPAARFARGITQRHRDWLPAHEARLRMRAAWTAFFRDYDVLLCPVTPTAAIPHDHSEPINRRRIVVNGKARPYWDQLAWVGLVGVAGLPATTAPVGLTPDGLPVGIQVVGPYLEDHTAIAFAGHLAEMTGGFRRPPRLERIPP